MRCCLRLPRAPLALPAARVTIAQVGLGWCCLGWCSLKRMNWQAAADRPVKSSVPDVAAPAPSCACYSGCARCPESRGDPPGNCLRACVPCGSGRLLPNSHCWLGACEWLGAAVVSTRAPLPVTLGASGIIDMPQPDQCWCPCVGCRRLMASWPSAAWFQPPMARRCMRRPAPGR